MTKPKPVLRPDRLADQLHAATQRHGASGYEIGLTALATANVMLGAGDRLLTAMLTRLSETATTVEETTVIWKQMRAHFGYLDGPVDALIGWTERAHDHQVAALAACYQALVGCDLPAAFDSAGGELLGPVYSLMRGLGARQASGAFYSPMSLSTMLGQMVIPEEGDRVLEPCCGAGGMILGAIRAMRSAGRDPNTCTWVLNDLDPIAVALAGVNMAAHGIRDVTLTRGDGLAMPWLEETHEHGDQFQPVAIDKGVNGFLCRRCSQVVLDTETHMAACA